MLDIIGGTVARLAPLHVDDGAERTLIGTAAAGVEAGAESERARHISLREKRHHGAFHSRQVVHEIVDRREPAGGCVLENRFETPFGLAGEDRNAEVAAGVEFDRAAVQHR